jgi:menaquinone-dependent protoporphyrinogen oxidase
MKILIVHASRHGSTAEVAEQIGDVLRESGHDVVVWAAHETPSPRNYDAVVAGTAIYGGRALADLEQYVATYRNELASKRLALFAITGDLGADMDEHRRQAEAALRPLATGASCLTQTAFSGVVDLRRAPWHTRLGMRLRKAQSEDHKNWDEVRSWALELSKRLGE